MRTSSLRKAACALGLSLTLGLPLYAPAADATVVVLHCLAEMTTRAELIVQARVADQRVVREDGHIVTYTDIEVIEGIKGARAGEILTIYQVGGTLDGKTTEVVGAHQHQLEEEMVFFGVRRGGKVISYGVGVGKFRVTRDDDGVLVVPVYGDISVMNQTPGEKPTFGAPPASTPRPLDEFMNEVRYHSEHPVVLDLPRRKPATVDMLKRRPAAETVTGNKGR